LTSRTIRKAILEDVPRLAEIRNDAVAYKLGHRDFAWGESGWTEAVALRIFSQGEMYLIEQDSIPAGMMSLSWKDEIFWGPQDPDAGYVHRVSVLSGFRGHGLGRFAIDWCEQHVRDHARIYLRLDCDVRNARLCAYYESLGFKRVATKPIPELGDYVASLYEKPVRTRTATPTQ
jgi:ribosomal protein S18 acetylase RimI-like enzyme